MNSAEMLQQMFQDAAARGLDQLLQDRAAKADECSQRAQEEEAAQDQIAAANEANVRLTAEGNRITEELRKAMAAQNAELIDCPASSAALLAETTFKLHLAEHAVSSAHRHLVEGVMPQRRIRKAEATAARRKADAELAQLDAQIAVLKLQEAIAPLSAEEGAIAISSQKTERLVELAAIAMKEHLRAMDEVQRLRDALEAALQTADAKGTITSVNVRPAFLRNQ